MTHTVALLWGRIGPVRRWRALRKFDLGRPEGVSRGDYARFLRDQLLCVLLGHKETTLLHRFRRVGTKGQMELREACLRCGYPLEERRSKVAQFHQPRDREDWRR